MSIILYGYPYMLVNVEFDLSGLCIGIVHSSYSRFLLTELEGFAFYSQAAKNPATSCMQGLPLRRSCSGLIMEVAPAVGTLGLHSAMGNYEWEREFWEVAQLQFGAGRTPWGLS